MPELPEVEVVRLDLEKQIANGQRVLKFVFHRQDIRDPIPTKKINKLQGQVLKSIHRRGKYLLFGLENGFLISHLGMSGHWRYENIKNRQWRKHDHVEIHFDNDSCFIFNDPRRFGLFDYTDDLQKYAKLKDLGPEPLSDEFSAAVLFEKTQQSHRSIKTLLMDPKTVVGVGNIYASEILFKAGIKPQRQSRRVSLKELEKIVELTREILHRAIENGGSTIKTFQQTNGNSGKFQNEHQVYGREEKKCYRCSGVIRKVEISGRSSFWCPGCQK